FGESTPSLSPSPSQGDGGPGGGVALDPLVDAPVLSGGDPNISFFQLWTRRLSVLLPVTILGSLLAVPPTIASATTTLTMTVNSNADTNDTTAQTACTGALSGCTLRAALYDAVQSSQQALYSAITINFSQDMRITVGSPLTWQDSDVTSFDASCSSSHGGGVVS